jgi:hypothetical protein
VDKKSGAATAAAPPSSSNPSDVERPLGNPTTKTGEGQQSGSQH